MDTKMFTSGQKIREERSNAGVQALAQSILMNILGLTRSSTQEIMGLLQRKGEDALMRQSLKLLNMTTHSRLNQILDYVETSEAVPDDDLEDEDIEDIFDQTDDMQSNIEPSYDDEDPLTGPDDPDNDNLMDYTSFRASETSDWSPEEDREEAKKERRKLSPVADPDDYKFESTKHKLFSSYLIETSREGKVDAAIAKMTDEEDEKLDPNTKKQIDRAEANGDSDRATRLRDAAKRRQGLLNKPKSPTQRRVEQKKRELADALERNRKAGEA